MISRLHSSRFSPNPTFIGRLSCLRVTTGSVSVPIAMMPAPYSAGAGLARAMARAGSVAGRRAVATYAIRPQEALLRELWAQQHEHQPKVSQVGSPFCVMHEPELWLEVASRQQVLPSMGLQWLIPACWVLCAAARCHSSNRSSPAVADHPNHRLPQDPGSSNTGALRGGGCRSCACRGSSHSAC